MPIQFSTPPGSAHVSASGTLVVARLVDGSVIKGTTQDFGPAKARFHIFPNGDASALAVAVNVSNLKAVFFVRSYDGDPSHEDDYSFDRVRGHGRKAVVTFHDNETVTGYTMGYHADKPGFFLVPVDENGNNSRIFIVNAAVKNIEQA